MALLNIVYITVASVYLYAKLNDCTTRVQILNVGVKKNTHTHIEVENKQTNKRTYLAGPWSLVSVTFLNTPLPCNSSDYARDRRVELGAH